MLGMGLDTVTKRMIQLMAAVESTSLSRPGGGRKSPKHLPATSICLLHWHLPVNVDIAIMEAATESDKRGYCELFTMYSTFAPLNQI